MQKRWARPALELEVRSGGRYRRPGGRPETRRAARSQTEPSTLRCSRWLQGFGRWVRDSRFGRWLVLQPLTQRALLLLEASLWLLILGLLSQLHLGLPCLLLSLSYWLLKGPIHASFTRALSWLRPLATLHAVPPEHAPAPGPGARTEAPASPCARSELGL
ncbi:hypothetical protein AAFF_G00398170 [Aldrovandia affinis]|uniref:Uncharacterized protein n=1 Tax=Aldrovandia affinis TaxID=143900 RepID=A0AAD7R3R9_9TELE|nr:hypothetical protein AAFF_G00398170 [Aldrovandia affinis]